MKTKKTKKPKKIDLKVKFNIVGGMPTWDFDRAVLRKMTMRDLIRDLYLGEDDE